MKEAGNTVKDKWHNANDITLAIIIIIAAAAIIFWRFHVLMDYPDKLANDTMNREIAAEKNSKNSKAVDKSPIKMGSAFEDGKLKNNVNITIKKGADEAAFKDLFDKHLFDDFAQFKSALKTLNLSVKDVQVGTMGFNKGTSVETVLRDMTTT